jgi:hypothetical protein
MHTKTKQKYEISDNNKRDTIVSNTWGNPCKNKIKGLDTSPTST